jgi:predicted nuclease of predicted toxin-antitoxin system
LVVADALRAAGAQVEVHDDHFAPNAKDEEWIQEIGKRGWMVITKDKWIRYRTPERVALITGGVQAFVLTGGSMTAQQMGVIFVKALRKINRLSQKERGPFIARVGRDGSVSIIERG